MCGCGELATCFHDDRQECFSCTDCGECIADARDDWSL